MAANRNSIGFFGCFILLFFSSCSLVTQPYENEYPVEVSDVAFAEYYRQFQGRFLLWQASMGIPKFEIPRIGGIQSIHFYEFQSTPNFTCYFRKPADILVGNDKWQSGCVAHELMHAILYQIGHPCWGEAEHPDEKQKCLERFE